MNPELKRPNILKHKDTWSFNVQNFIFYRDSPLNIATTVKMNKRWQIYILRLENLIQTISNCEHTTCCPTHLSTDRPMITPYCVFIIVHFSVYQKLEKDHCKLRNKWKLKVNIIYFRGSVAWFVWVGRWHLG